MSIVRKFWCMMGLAALLSAATVAAEGPRPDELLDRAERVHREQLERQLDEVKRHMLELRERGRHDEAAKLERHLHELRVRLEEPGGASEGEGRRKEAERREELHRREQKERDEAFERELKVRHAEAERHQREQEQLFRAMREGWKPERPEPPAAALAERRAQHLREAAEHLQAAGMAGPAQDLREQAEKLLRQHPHPPAHPAELRELHEVLARQNERIERLEAMVRQLAEAIERRRDEEKPREE